VVKAPYTTNKKCRFFAPTIEKVFDSLDIIYGRYGPNSDRSHSIIPYIMIQPCMKNRIEYKTVLLNKKAIAYSSVNKGKAFGTRELHFKWAEDAINLLEKNCPEALLDGLTRVDSFCNAKEEWRVNEFEGFEAGFTTTPDNDLTVQEFLVAYWFKYILKYVYGTTGGTIITTTD